MGNVLITRSPAEGLAIQRNGAATAMLELSDGNGSRGRRGGYRRAVRLNPKNEENSPSCTLPLSSVIL